MLEITLFAIDLDTIVQIAVFLFIIISSLAGHFFKPKPARPAKPRPPAAPAPVRDNIDEPVTAHLERQRLEDEIDAMMKKATGQSARQPDRPARPQPVVEARVVPAVAVQSPRESVAEHVSKHISSGGMGGMGGMGSLGSSIERADERLETHLHETFDHGLGQLPSSRNRKEAPSSIRQGTDSGVWQPQSETSSELARNIARMLRSPADVSAAIVLSEIIKRPEDRWS